MPPHSNIEAPNKSSDKGLEPLFHLGSSETSQQNQFSMTSKMASTDAESKGLASKTEMIADWKLRFNPCQDAFPGGEITKIGQCPKTNTN